MRSKNQMAIQAIVTPQETLDPNLTSESISLFNEDGTPISLDTNTDSISSPTEILIDESTFGEGVTSGFSPLKIIDHGSFYRMSGLIHVTYPSDVLTALAPIFQFPAEVEFPYMYESLSWVCRGTEFMEGEDVVILNANQAGEVWYLRLLNKHTGLAPAHDMNIYLDMTWSHL